MLTLNTCSEAAIRAFGEALLADYRDGLGSFEKATQVVVTKIYNEFRQPSGQSTFALFRIFRLTPRRELPPELVPTSDPAINRWVTLTGTIGDEPAWCDRRQSQGHQAISEDKAVQAPMLKAVFDQIGLGWGTQVDQTLETERATGSPIRYFHVPIAFDSPHIPNQQSFVEPFKIRSVIGLGDRFSSGAAFVALGFAKNPIYATESRKFVVLAPYLSALLAIYEGRGVIWEP